MQHVGRRFISSCLTKVSINIAWLAAILIIPLGLAFYFFDLWHWDFSVPLLYSNPGKDEIWQLVMTKTLLDTGWVLHNPFLGMPGTVDWYDNSGAQTSAIHSVIMLGISIFTRDSVRVQQIYYFGNFSLITFCGFLCCRTFGIARLLSFFCGLLFAFTSYRLNEMIYAYLSNYFIVPLALIPILWIAQGQFSHAPTIVNGKNNSDKIYIRGLLKSKHFLSGLVLTTLAGVTDGYYAFFTLLLLAFATFFRIIVGDYKIPISLIVPITYMLAMLATVSALSYPLSNYRAHHPDIANQDALKLASDAQIYSPSPMLLVAPIDNNRMAPLAALGNRMIDVANSNRKIPDPRGTPAPLGTLGSILFAIALTILITPAKQRFTLVATRPHASQGERRTPLLSVLVALSLFIFLCSITGGIGGVIALVFPSIRAYERFPVFLIFLLYLGAGFVVTHATASATRLKRWCCDILVLIAGIAALFDQVPIGLLLLTDANSTSRKSFLADRQFVRSMEASLPEGTMIYQYPYSQFLTDSKYYGWASFGQIRLYLNSHSLRWSNGASKGSAADVWGQQVASLPIKQLLTEVAAAGFGATVIDRTVVKSEEYARVAEVFNRMLGTSFKEDDDAHLAYATVRNLGYRLVYDPLTVKPVKIIITDRRLTAKSPMSIFVNRDALNTVLKDDTGSLSVTIDRSTHPEIFNDSIALQHSLGEVKLTSPADMRGDVSCGNMGLSPYATLTGKIDLSVYNRTSFDWYLNAGPYPIKVGIHILSTDGSIVKWEGGRVDASTLVPSDSNSVLEVPLSILDLGGIPDEIHEAVAEFSLLQEGNAWFNQADNKVCRIAFRR